MPLPTNKPTSIPPQHRTYRLSPHLKKAYRDARTGWASMNSTQTPPSWSKSCCREHIKQAGQEDRESSPLLRPGQEGAFGLARGLLFPWRCCSTSVHGNRGLPEPEGESSLLCQSPSREPSEASGQPTVPINNGFSSWSNVCGWQARACKFHPILWTCASGHSLISNVKSFSRAFP